MLTQRCNHNCHSPPDLCHFPTTFINYVWSFKITNWCFKLLKMAYGTLVCGIIYNYGGQKRSLAWSVLKLKLLSKTGYNKTATGKKQDTHCNRNLDSKTEIIKKCTGKYVYDVVEIWWFCLNGTSQEPALAAVLV